MIVLLLGDLDSNQEWRIQSPLFCQLNYLPLRTINIPQALKYFKLYLTLIKCSPPELCLNGGGLRFIGQRCFSKFDAPY